MASRPGACVVSRLRHPGGYSAASLLTPIVATRPLATSQPNTATGHSYALDDKKGYRTPGLEDLGITKTNMESIGINVLRKYRPHVYHDDIVDNL